MTCVASLTRLLRRATAGASAQRAHRRARRCRVPPRPPLGLEGIVSKRLGSPYRSGRSRHWIKSKNPDAPALRREAEELPPGLMGGHSFDITNGYILGREAKRVSQEAQIGDSRKGEAKEAWIVDYADQGGERDQLVVGWLGSHLRCRSCQGMRRQLRGGYRRAASSGKLPGSREACYFFPRGGGQADSCPRG
jgi:hypothetical protein